MASKVFSQLLPTARKSLATLLLFSSMLPLSLSAGAWDFKLPGGLTYTIEGDITSFQKRPYRYVKEVVGDQSTEISFTKPQGYIQYLGGGSQISGDAQGDLLIAISVSHDQASGPPMSLGINWSQGGERSDKTSPESLLETSEIVAAEVASVEAEVSLSGHAISHSLTGINVPVTVSKGDTPNYFAWLKVPDISYESFDHKKPSILLAGHVYTLQDRLGSLPDKDVVVIMHFVPYSHCGFSLTIHGSTPGAQQVRVDTRELDESELNDIASLITLNIAKRIARRFSIQETTIENTLATLAGQPASETSFQLLKVILEQKASDFTSEALAKELEAEHLANLAERVRTRQLEVSSEDKDFQLEMVTLSNHITPFVRPLALAMSFQPQDVDEVMQKDQPGFELLHKAYQKKLLGKLYTACKSVGLEDVPRQIQDSTGFPILASRVQQQESTEQPAQSNVAELLPVSFQHIDHDLLALEPKTRELGDLLHPLMNPSGRLDHFVDRLESLPGSSKFDRKPDTPIQQHEVATRMLNVLYLAEETKLGRGFPRHKLLVLMNQLNDMESRSLAMREVKYLESPQVDVDDKDLLSLAFQYKDADRCKSLSFLTGRKNPDSHESRLSMRLAHCLQIQCEEDLSCRKQVEASQSWQRQRQHVKECLHFPLLATEVARLKIQPHRFITGKAS